MATKIFIVDDAAQLSQEEHSAFALFGDNIDNAIASSSPDKFARVAYDCEGVDLSRVGTVEIIAFCFETKDDDAAPGQQATTFLVDVGNGSNSSLRQGRIDLIRKLFASETVEMIIHDSRMDCDALNHLLKLDPPKRMHDTSCFHHVITGIENQPLNVVLAYNGLVSNTTRDKSVYKANPRFWATRPITPRMKEWSASDVDKLFKVASKQRETLEKAVNTMAMYSGARCSSKLEKAEKMSMDFSTYLLKMECVHNLPCKVPPGRFIGKGGANIRSLQKRTGTIIYQDHCNSIGKQVRWLVYYPNESALQQVKANMNEMRGAHW